MVRASCRLSISKIGIPETGLKLSSVSSSHFSIAEACTTKKSQNLPINEDLILDPNTRPPGFEFRRHERVFPYDAKSWGGLSNV
jgi:hypothetical protein